MAMARRRKQLLVRSAGLAALLIVCERASAQSPAPGLPLPAPAPAPGVCSCGRVHERPGPIRGAFRHANHAIHEHFIGDPDLFDVPPLGYDVYRVMGAQVAKADLHTFMLYRSDFLVDGTALSPAGAKRLSFLSSELPRWSGPVVIEWTPEAPPLAESRRSEVVALLQGAGVPLDPARVLVGPSPYRGFLGVDSANVYDTLIYRDLAAPRAFSLTPSANQAGGGAR